MAFLPSRLNQSSAKSVIAMPRRIVQHRAARFTGPPSGESATVRAYAPSAAVILAIAAVSSSCTPPFASATFVGDLEHEGAVGGELVRRLRRERRDSGGERGHRALVDLLRRRDEAEAGAVHLGELADELARVLAVAARSFAIAFASPKLSVKSRCATETSIPEPMTPFSSASHSSSVKSALPAIVSSSSRMRACELRSLAADAQVAEGRASSRKPPASSSALIRSESGGCVWKRPERNAPGPVTARVGLSMKRCAVARSA